MRKKFVLALAVSALALAGCKTNEELDAGPAGFDLCSPNCPTPTDDDDDTTGNDVSLKDGDTTLALEDGKLVSPAGGSKSKLTSKDGGKTAKYEIDTGGSSNSSWPAAETLAKNVAASGGNGLGAKDYHEFADTDTQLQVWDFGHSYAVQYRDISGGLGPHQAYSFGGNKTVTMPTIASATYNGHYGSTAKAENWVKPESAAAEVIDPNGVFASNGTAQIIANFDARTINGTLKPQQWLWRGTDSAWNTFDVPKDEWTKSDGTKVVGTNVIEPFHFHSDINFKGTITGNTYAGSTTIPGFAGISPNSPVYGGFFGPNAEQTTGVFHVDASDYDPTGSQFPGVDNGKGTLSHSGVFSGDR